MLNSGTFAFGVTQKTTFSVDETKKKKKNLQDEERALGKDSEKNGYSNVFLEREKGEEEEEKESAKKGRHQEHPLSLQYRF